jgi:hypothetical protein
MSSDSGRSSDHPRLRPPLTGHPGRATMAKQQAIGEPPVRGRWPLMLRTGWVVLRRDDPGVAVGKLDGQEGVGDQHGDGLPGVGAAEGGCLPGDHDHATLLRCLETRVCSTKVQQRHRACIASVTRASAWSAELDHAPNARPFPRPAGGREARSLRITLEVVLIFGLGLPEGTGRADLGHDLAGPMARDCLLGAGRPVPGVRIRRRSAPSSLVRGRYGATRCRGKPGRPATGERRRTCACRVWPLVQPMAACRRDGYSRAGRDQRRCPGDCVTYPPKKANYVQRITPQEAESRHPNV